jgi:hypothetical protein
MADEPVCRPVSVPAFAFALPPISGRLIGRLEDVAPDTLAFDSKAMTPSCRCPGTW